jgi:hypothetical protein
MKIQRLYLKVFIAISIPILIKSCSVKEYEMDLEGYKPMLVINSFFNEGEYLRVNISATRAITSNEEFFAIENAEVALFENDTFRENLNWQEAAYWSDEINRGNYFSNLTKAQAGNKYRIEVTAPGYDQVIAESTVPFNTSINYLSYEWFEITEDIFTDLWLRSYLDMENTADRNDYYLYVSTRVGGTQSFRYPMFEVDNPVIGQTQIVLFNNELMDGPLLPFSLNIPQSELGDTSREMVIKYSLATLSTDAYLYLKTRTDQKNNDIRFSEPIKIHSNVKGGAGIFAAMNISTDSLLLN